MSIPELILKIKRRISLTVPLKLGIMAGVLGLFFILGRLSTTSQTSSIPLPQIIYPPLITPHFSETKPLPYPEQERDPGGTEATWKAVASKTGKVYYTPTCTSFNRIKEENRVYFTEESEAVAAGYSLSSLCTP